MKFFAPGVAASALTIALLTGCGGSTSSVTLKDPLGLGNGARTVDIDLSHDNNVVVQNLGPSVAGSMPILLGSFEDINEKIPFVPKQISIAQGWAGNVTLKTDPNTTLPNVLTLKDLKLQINLSDAATSININLFGANDAQATCGQEQIVNNVKTKVCNFGTVNGKMITVLDAPSSAQFLKIISQGGTNSLDATFSVRIDELPAGQQISFNLPFGEGTAVVTQ